MLSKSGLSFLAVGSHASIVAVSCAVLLTASACLKQTTKSNTRSLGSAIPDADFPELTSEFDLISTQIARRNTDEIESIFRTSRNSKLKELNASGGPRKRLALTKIMELVAVKVQMHADSVIDAQGERTLVSLDQVRDAIELLSDDRFGFYYPKGLLKIVLEWWDEKAVSALSNPGDKNAAVVLSLASQSSFNGLLHDAIEHVDTLSDISGMGNYSVEEALTWTDKLPRKGLQIVRDTRPHEVVLVNKKSLLDLLFSVAHPDINLQANSLSANPYADEISAFASLDETKKKIVIDMRTKRDSLGSFGFKLTDTLVETVMGTSGRCKLPERRYSDRAVRNALYATINFLIEKLRLDAPPLVPLRGDEQNVEKFKANPFDWTRYDDVNCNGA